MILQDILSFLLVAVSGTDRTLSSSRDNSMVLKQEPWTDSKMSGTNCASVSVLITFRHDSHRFH